MNSLTNNAGRQHWAVWKRFVTYASLLVLVLLIGKHYYPVGLEKAIGTRGLSEHDISSITVSVDIHVNQGESTIQKTDIITDKDLIRGVLDTLSNHRMRRLARKPIYYYPGGGLDKPAWVRLYIRFMDDQVDTIVSIPSSAKHVSINGKVHKLYGKGLDNMKLWAILEQSLSRK